MSAIAREICLTELDVVRLESMLDRVRRRSPDEQDGAEELEMRVDAAKVVDPKAIGPQVVTMNSIVALLDPLTNARTELSLVFPQDADADHSRVSVLSPVGRALIGAQVGDTVHVAVPGEPDKALVVAAIVYQPEAHGHYDR
jgi:regulator of nucleoside diphosphate kinase